MIEALAMYPRHFCFFAQFHPWPVQVSAAQRQLLSEMLGEEVAAGGTGAAFERRDKLLRTPNTAGGLNEVHFAMAHLA